LNVIKQPNVFLVEPTLGPEDRFTAHWAYLLHCHPELAQNILDRIADWTGLPRSEYVASTDHPWYTAEDRPDFLIESRDYNVLFEHKLDSELGPAQLERYCALARSSPKESYLVLVGKKPLPIPGHAEGLDRYRQPTSRPKTGSARSHFLWEDFYDLVRAVPGRLATDFAAYMAALGLDPWPYTTIGDPFTSYEARSQFRQLWRDVLPRYRRRGSLIKQDPVGAGFQFQKPMPGVHLIYVGPYRVIDAPADPRVPGRAMVARVWQREDQLVAANLLATRPSESPTNPILSSDSEIFIRAPNQVEEFAVLTREYYSQLSSLMHESPWECQETLQRWFDAILAHLERDLAVSVESRAQL